MNKVVHVAAAAIFGADGRLLISKRPAHVHQGGLWEFPGGKVEPGETVSEALCRELQEELGIVTEQYSPLIRIPYSYPDKTVLLDVWRVIRFSGKPVGCEGQALKWLDTQELDAAAFPAANRPIIDALLLPDRYMITGPSIDDADYLNRFERALKAGIQMVQFRANHSFQSALLEKSIELCRRYRALLILNDSLELASEFDVDGIHLTSKQLVSIEADTLRAWRETKEKKRNKVWIGASCHNEAELKRATELGANYASLSPIQKTGSHPDTAALGMDRFRYLVDKASIPVFALGGMSMNSTEQVIQYGGQGIAAISAFWEPHELEKLSDAACEDSSVG
ncbi:Nudix family hydrolase [Motiliproteus sp. MSK22-1]|uniref:Nudix family hydrolase n=1 Tax=Motiliproteus sp. MSK22-1 TaxID=1897630 RepID=UPI001300FCA7|nr:Nudix family hydrolase [Motiliproteus sp. MSK22-1]